MPFVLEPQDAGPPGALEASGADDLIGSFPVFLVSAALAARLADGDYSGVSLHPATEGYRRLVPDAGATAPDVWIDDDHHLCVSDRLMAVLRGFELGRCEVSSY